MQPEQDQPTYPIDYLNQIAVAPQKAGPSKKTFLILVGLGVGVFIVASLGIFSALSKSSTTDLQHLSARLTSLKSTATSAQKHIKNSQLRSANGSLTVILSNASRDLNEPLQAAGINPKKLDKSIVAAEKNSELTETLDNARLNALYDETYAREITYQLATINALTTKLYNQSNDSALRDYLSTTNKNLQLVKQQFTDYASPSRTSTD